MRLIGTSDLLTNLQSKFQNRSISSQLNRLVGEISSGEKADPTDGSGSIRAKLASLTHSKNILVSFNQAIKTHQTEKAIEYQAIQSMIDSQESIGPQILANLSSGSEVLEPFFFQASNVFDASFSSLMSRVGNRYIFSGLESTTPPLVGASTIISELELAVSAATDANSAWSAIDQWFTQVGGPFDTLAYQGGEPTVSSIRLSSTYSLTQETLASDLVFRENLRNLSVFKLIESGGISLPDAEIVNLVEISAKNILENQNQLIETSATIGQVQQQIDRASNQNSTEEFVFGKAVNEIKQVDLFEAVSRFEELESQLESLYLVTAKSSRLSLTQYIR